MEDEKTEEKIEDKKEKNIWRQIIIETNGTDVNIKKAEVAGNLELLAILQSLIGYISTKK